MNSVTRYWWIGLIAAVGLAVSWWFNQDRSGQGQYGGAVAVVEDGGDTPQKRLHVATGDSLVSRDMSEAGREPVSPEFPIRVRGRLVNRRGEGIPGCKLEWAIVRNRGEESYLSLGNTQRPFVVIARVEGFSGADGFFELKSAESEELRSGELRQVLWVSKLGYGVDFLDESLALEGVWAVGDWDLNEKACTQVWVEGDIGAGAAVAIAQNGVGAWSKPWLSKSAMGKYGTLYKYSAKTDSAGFAELPFCSTMTSVRGLAPDGAVREWRGTDPDEIHFLFGQTVTLSGTVAVGPDTSPPAAATIRFERVGAKTGQRFLSVTTDENLHWGPVKLGIDGASSMLVEARAEGFYGTRIGLEVLKGGESLAVDLVLSRGNDVWALACDRQWEPVPEALVRAEWTDNFGVRTKRMLPQASGHVQFTGLPDGIITLSAISEGYQESRLVMHTPEKEPVSHSLPMGPGGVIAGVCTLEGKPCVDFEILTWPVGNSSVVVRGQFESQAGQFELHGVAAGEIEVVAVSLSGGMSKSVSVTAGSRAATEIELEVGLTNKVTGRLVGEFTSRLQGGSVQVDLNGVDAGPQVRTENDGSFSIPVGIATPDISIRVRAVGHSTRLVQLEVKDGRSSDVGLIELQELRSLEVTIQSAADPLDVIVSCHLCDMPEKSPDLEGKVTYSHIDAGSHNLRIEVEELMYMTVPVEVVTQEMTKIAVDLTGKNTLRVHLDGGPEEPHGGLFVDIKQVRDGYARGLAFMGWTNGDEVLFKHLAAGNYKIVVSDETGKSLAVKSVNVRIGSSRSVAIDLSKSRIPIRVEDLEGNALAGVSGQYFHEGGPFEGGYITNSKGLMELVPLGPGPGFLCLWKDGIGHHWNIPISLPETAPEEPIVVVMECEAALTLKLYDRAGPIAKQPCRLYGTGYAIEVSHPRSTDEMGLVTFPKLSPGAYQMRVTAPDHWTYYKDFVAGLTGEIQEVEIPRLVHLTVEVRSSQGLPVTGQAVQVWSLDYDKDTKYWQDVGAMTVEPADWKSDAMGQIHIPVFPEGRYRVSVLDGNGEARQVEVELRPGESNVVRLILP